MNSGCFNALEIYSTNMLEDSHERENKLQVRQIEFNVNSEMTVKDCVVTLTKPCKRKQYDIKFFRQTMCHSSKLTKSSPRSPFKCGPMFIYSFFFTIPLFNIFHKVNK